VNQWKSNFVERLNKAQKQCAKRFESAVDEYVNPAFDELGGFLRDNGFQCSSPLNEPGRRSFKFELAENAYLLMIFRFSGVGEFDVRSEIFVPGCEPVLRKSVGRITDVDGAWSEKLFQESLDSFVRMLSGESAAPLEAELALA